MAIVDVHAHCIPQVLIDRLILEGASVGLSVASDDGGVVVTLPNGRRLGPLRNDLTDPALRLEAMDQAGIARQVLSSWIDLTAYSIDDGGRYTRWLNEALAAEAATEPDRFVAVCSVPLQQPEVAAAELEHAVTELGMVGVEIATRVNDTPLEESDLDVFWSTAERLGVFVLLHPLDPLPGVDLRRRFLHNSIGRPAETTIAVAGIILGGVLERFPGLRICAVHGGGFAPFQIGRVDRSYLAKPRVVADEISLRPSEYLRGMFVDTVVHEPAVLRFLVEWFGPDRVVVGTDYPFEMGDDDPVGFVENAGLTPDLVHTVLHENGTRLITPQPIETRSTP